MPDPGTVECLLRTVLHKLGGGEPGVGVAFVDDMAMIAHHERYSADISTTDVLSFPADDEDIGPKRYLGDIIICTDEAMRQARHLGHPYGYEVAVLVLHGVLHLLGYDHARDSGEMNRLEETLRPRVMRAGWRL